MRTLLLVCSTGLVLLGAARLAPTGMTNPPVLSNVPAEPVAEEILRAACYGCHSNETVWPWYSQLAPISWLVGKEVRDARKAVNFSIWDLYDTEEQADLLRRSWEVVVAGEMPPGSYVLLHSAARLSDSDLEALSSWAGVSSEEP